MFLLDWTLIFCQHFSLTKPLTDWFLFRLDWCDFGFWRCQLKTCCWGTCWQQVEQDFEAVKWQSWRTTCSGNWTRIEPKIMMDMFQSKVKQQLTFLMVFLLCILCILCILLYIRTQKKLTKICLRLRHTYKNYILQNKWPRLVNFSPQSLIYLQQPRTGGRHHQLDDHRRNPNINTKII